MTYYEGIKEKLASGYIIFCEEYRDGEKIYSIRTPKVDGSTTVYCEIAGNIARKLSKETGQQIIKADKICVALNFIPMPVKPGCVRTFHSGDISEPLLS